MRSGIKAANPAPAVFPINLPPLDYRINNIEFTSFMKIKSKINFL